jgi:hypothetical protein
MNQYSRSKKSYQIGTNTLAKNNSLDDEYIKTSQDKATHPKNSNLVIILLPIGFVKWKENLWKN